ncbi:TetR/AcrR family transcriptional regulator [Candidatus Chloroploca asiatica]|uniref:HTH tetR-type domain-containing protein n=1 Tax=Candidatus Chloroploca asiatica TaxID=1506545 RepID=A0A2H3KIA1_9CHLR|nr:TetR/AcrR family transcriptional regulator [Candidatus Chloroploca asiatica]PDV97569.1 hypothetical protein A9Q02_03695 [Candidatus Chloroploca asiatica]
MARAARAARGNGAATANQIKVTARAQMAAHGTAGLSLRGIARAMAITAPAIYNYFPSLDDLITALIIDAFTSLAEATEAAEAAVRKQPPFDRIMAICLAYRHWAISHPTDFLLIYGNPIPGYQAPEELTIPLARRPFLGLFHLFASTFETGTLQIPPSYQDLPGEMSTAIAAWKRSSAIEMPDALVVLLMSGWARVHGTIMLEMFHHLQPLVGDGEAFFVHEVTAFAAQLGVQ